MKPTTTLFVAVALVAALQVFSVVRAQPATAVAFAITGIIQNLTVNTPANILSAGTLVVNDITVIVPANLVVVFPAAYWTLSQALAMGPAPGSSGLALGDPVRSPGAYEASIIGNIVNGQYIAGDVQIAPSQLQNTDGFVRSINYTSGELCIGATSAPLVGPCVAPNARIRLIDPTGVYGIVQNKDDLRFAVDPDNPTVLADTGYPMCIPRVTPPFIDTNCPLGNRPINGAGTVQNSFVMSGPNYPATPAGGKGVIATPFVPSCNNFPAFGATPTGPNQCNPAKGAPIMVGDFVSYAGVIAADGAIATTSIDVHVGIYTQQGPGNIVYLRWDDHRIGTGPIVCAGAPVEECSYSTRVVGFITDPSRIVAGNIKLNFYYVDVNPVTGQKFPRLLATPAVLNGAGSPMVPQAFFGRFRLDVLKKTANVFVPPNTGGLTGQGGLTRELLVSVDDNGPLNPLVPIANPQNSPQRVQANGVIAGQYWAPVPEFIFPEPAAPGLLPPTANFACLSHAVAGWSVDLNNDGISDAIPPLSPFPDVPGVLGLGINCNT